MRLSIRFQLLLPLVVLLGGVLATSVWTAMASADRAWMQIEAQMRGIAKTADQSHYELTDKVLQLIKGFSGAEFYRDAGKRHWTTLDAVPSEWPAPTEARDWEHLTPGPRVTVGGQSYFCNGVRLRSGPNAGSTLYILYPESLWRDALWAAIRPSLVFGAFGGAAAIVLAILLAQGLAKRILNLERRTRLIASGDFSPMPLPRRNDELRDLSRSINEMAQQLAQLQDAARKTEQLRVLGQVSGGLAHQLRNGVAGARLAVQLHLRECTDKGDGEALQVALRQLTRVELNLKQFLSLGRAGELRRERCKLATVVEEAVVLVQPQARHAGITMDVTSRWDDSQLFADAGQISHAVVNLLTNALEAAGPGGNVRIDLRLQGPSTLVLDIVDSGAGPGADLAGRLFEPFVTGKPEGVGLGLAVVRQVVEAHGGEVSWSREDRGTCFRVVLPVEAKT